MLEKCKNEVRVFWNKLHYCAFHMVFCHYTDKNLLHLGNKLLFYLMALMLVILTKKRLNSVYIFESQD